MTVLPAPICAITSLVGFLQAVGTRATVPVRSLASQTRWPRLHIGRAAWIGGPNGRKLQEGALWPEPLIQLNPAFEPGASVPDLVGRQLLHTDCRRVFAIKDESTGELIKPLRLYRHQLEAIEAARTGDSYVLTTGTGSGKSLTYVIPIVDFVLRNGSGQGIKAIVVYPMNALANSQEQELDKFVNRGYPSRAAIRSR